ncbi:hypothetical protein [Chitinophaga sp. RAB17]|uniref:hypothetical protein n=1 Tax=Chitinophaga sp. RAB17 TaxID=3233049 RepID=UPI003F914054
MVSRQRMFYKNTCQIQVLNTLIIQRVRARLRLHASDDWQSIKKLQSETDYARALQSFIREFPVVMPTLFIVFSILLFS